jgi:hypothetical protein
MTMMTTTTAVVAAATTTVATTTVATERPGATARLPRWGAGLLLVAGLVVGACASDDGNPSANSAAEITTLPSPTTAALPATAAPTAAATTPAPPPPSTIALPDGPTLLQQSLDAIAPGYHFVITATVNGTVALSTEGDQIGLASRQKVTSQGVTVDYIVLPEGTWKGENGAWEELEEPAPAVDPLAPLRTPTAVTVAGHSPELTTLVATYPAAPFGVPGDAINVTIELTGTALRSFTYSTPDGTQVSRTDIGPLADTTPITSPAVV